MSNANNLIKRIDESFFFVVDADGQQRLDKLLADCRAEIERPSKPYMPMTDDEIIEIADTAESNAFRMGSIVQETGYEGYRAIEAAVIKRAGLEIKHD